MTIERQRALRATVIYNLFVRTADENYITARWCVINRLYTDFFWLAVHALEKYLKAVLLSNGKSSIKDERVANSAPYSHDIVRLYDTVASFAAELLPKHVSVPPWCAAAPNELATKTFLQHLYRRGNADNRYSLHGYTARQPRDLLMVDSVVFAVRRLICPLDDRVFPERLRSAEPITYRELLADHPDHFCPLDMPLDHLIAATEDSPLRVAALNQNVRFAPPGFPHTSLEIERALQHPIIDTRIFGPLQSDNPYAVAEGLAIGKWLLANVYVPDKGKNSLGTKIRTAIASADRSE